MKYFVVTGASRGIGEGICQALFATSEGDVTVIGVSRSGDSKGVKALFDAAAEAKSTFHHIATDLSDAAALQDWTKTQLLPLVDQKECKELTFIHNAGYLCIGALGDHCKDAAETQGVTNVNFASAFVLTEQFVSVFGEWDCVKRLAGISSGAATKPYPHWGLYCATKAALDMMIKVLHEEQKERENGVQCMIISPGIVQTELQDKLVATKTLPQHEFFSSYRAAGKGRTPEESGRDIVAIFTNGDFGKELRIDMFCDKVRRPVSEE